MWTRFSTERGLREQLRAALPYAPTSPNAYDPADTALGCIEDILCGADKPARVAHFWLCPGNTACVSGAATFLGDTLARLPATVRVALVRADIAELYRQHWQIELSRPSSISHHRFTDPVGQHAS